MELQFQTDTLRYLRRIFRQTREQEETMETIIPDSFPDAVSVLLGSAVVTVRSKECCTGSATVSGGLRTTVMYAPEEGEPRALELYLPFTVRAEQPELTEQTSILFTPQIRSVDARLVNSRKLIVRVTFCYTLEAYASAEATLYQPQDPPEELQLRIREYPLHLPVEFAETTFPMSEEIELPPSAPYGGTVFSFTPRIEITEKKLNGNKAVFKGNVNLSLLYLTAENALETYETRFPFSQYCDLSRVYDEQTVLLSPVLTGCELEPIHGPEGERLLLSLQLLVQCVVTECTLVPFAEDAYTLQGSMEPQWEQYAFTGLTEEKTVFCPVTATGEGEVAAVEYAQTWLGEPTVTDGVTEKLITVPVTLQAIYRDEGDTLRSMTLRTEAETRISAAAGTGCTVSAAVTERGSTQPGGSGMEARRDVSLTLHMEIPGTYRSLRECTLTPATEKSAAKPAVILRRLGAEETLWDVAKSNGTTVERICRANRLETDAPAENTLLLIPT